MLALADGALAAAKRSFERHRRSNLAPEKAAADIVLAYLLALSPTDRFALASAILPAKLRIKRVSCRRS